MSREAMLNTILDRTPAANLPPAAKRFHSGGRVALFDMVPTQRLALPSHCRQKPVIYLLPNERAAQQNIRMRAVWELRRSSSLSRAAFIPLLSAETDWQRLRALDQIVMEGSADYLLSKALSCIYRAGNGLSRPP